MKLSFAIALILAVAALGSARAQEGVQDAQGVIEGTVVASSAESNGSVNGLETTLVIWKHGPTTTAPDSPDHPDISGSAAGTTEQRTTTTDASGAFRFEGLATGSDYVYTVAVNYATVDYWSDTVQLSDNPETSLQLPVYETTTDAGAVKVVLDHLAVQVNKDAQTIQILNYVKLHNGGDRTLVAAGASTMASQPTALHLALPKGASNIAPADGFTQENLSLDDDGLADSTPFPPGDREVVFSYDLPYSSASYLLERAVMYPTDKLAILMPSGNVQVDSAQLPNRNETEMEGQKFLVMTGENLSAGTPVQLSLAGLPKADRGIGAEVLQPLVLIVVVLALAGALAYWRLRRRWSARAERSEPA